MKKVLLILAVVFTTSVFAQTEVKEVKVNLESLKWLTANGEFSMSLSDVTEFAESAQLVIVRRANKMEEEYWYERVYQHPRDFVDSAIVFSQRRIENWSSMDYLINAFIYSKWDFAWKIWNYSRAYKAGSLDKLLLGIHISSQEELFAFVMERISHDNPEECIGHEYYVNHEYEVNDDEQRLFRCGDILMYDVDGDTVFALCISENEAIYYESDAPSVGKITNWKEDCIKKHYVFDDRAIKGDGLMVVQNVLHNDVESVFIEDLNEYKDRFSKRTLESLLKFIILNE